MAYEPGGYGTPPFPPYSYPDQNLTQSQTPTLAYQESTDEFKKLVMMQPPWIEVGNSARFSFYAEHKIDGVVQSWTTGPTVTVRDGNGNNVATNVTIGTVTKDPTQQGMWFSVIQFNAALAPGNYEIQWVATYTPTNTQEPQVALPVQVRRPFRVKSTQAPGQFFFKAVSQF